MSTFLPTVRRSLSDRLQRLCNSLDALKHQLREAIAGSVSKAVADAVSDAVRGLLDAGQQPHPPPDRYRWPPDPARPLWDQPSKRDYPDWSDPADDPWLQEDRYERDQDEERDLEPDAYSKPATSTMPRLGTWISAVAVGCRAGLWWLKCQQSKAPVLTTLAVGLAAAMVTLAAGSLMTAGVNAVGTIVGLTALADAVRSTAGGLAGLFT